MANMVKTTVYTNEYKDCLLAPHTAFEIGVQVDATGVSANAEGKKIIPAGTPIGGDTSALETRNAVLKVTNTSALGAKSQGILRYPVDVTSGAANATMIVWGIVDKSKCPTIDAAVAIPHILFVNGGKN